MALTRLLAVALAALTIGTSNSVSQTGWLLVANKGDQTLGIVDPETEREIATILADF